MYRLISLTITLLLNTGAVWLLEDDDGGRLLKLTPKIGTDQLRSQPKTDQGIFSTYYFLGGKDGFVTIYKNPKAILIDISAFTHTGVVKKTNM